VNIHPTAIVAAGAEIADGVEIGPYCMIGGHVRLGADVRLGAHVVIEGDTVIGPGCEIYPFAVLGEPPQHAAYRPGDACRLAIGARNLIREHVTIHGGSRAGRGATNVGDDCVFYVGSHVGHDCQVGERVTLTNGATLGGHACVGDYAILGGLCAVQQRVRIGRYAFVGGMAGVNFDVIPFGMVWGNHARLEGLNLVGLKRRGFSREEIATLRAGFRDIFEGQGPLRERVECAAAKFAGSPQVMEIIDFIRSEPTRPLILPAGKD
jgi:UDP-N-acetylglucosamine acyltransferase